MSKAMRSPCLQICRMAAGDALCEGCGRTLREITQWSRYSDDERAAIMAALPARQRGDTRVSNPEEELAATLQRVDSGWEGRMQRRFAVPRARVWALLTNADLLPLWLAPGSVETRLGGTVALHFADSGTVIESEVRAYEDGRLLAYGWSRAGEPDRPVRWQLSEAPDGTLLSLSVGVPSSEDIGRACAGFDAHLQMLQAALDGTPIDFPFAHFKRMRALYKTQLASVA